MGAGSGGGGGGKGRGRGKKGGAKKAAISPIFSMGKTGKLSRAVPVIRRKRKVKKAKLTAGKAATVSLRRPIKRRKTKK